MLPLLADCYQGTDEGSALESAALSALNCLVMLGSDAAARSKLVTALLNALSHKNISDQDKAIIIGAFSVLAQKIYGADEPLLKQVCFELCVVFFFFFPFYGFFN